MTLVNMFSSSVGLPKIRAVLHRPKAIVTAGLLVAGAFGFSTFGSNETPPATFAAEQDERVESTDTSDEATNAEDRTEVDCPVGSKRGDATIRIDSTNREWTITTIKPDSQFKAKGEHLPVDWNELELVSRGDINRDGRMDAVVKIQFDTARPVGGRHHWVFVSCGRDRYVSVTPILRLDRDHLHRTRKVEKPWPNLTALGEVRRANHPKGYYYRQTYRYNKEEERYRPVSGSARYKKESAKRLGINLDDRPQCSVGKGPPIRIQPTEKTKRPLQPGDSVRIEPTYHPEKSYEIEWAGDLNYNKRDDLVVEVGCGSADRCRHVVYYRCSTERHWYSVISEEIHAKEINVDDENKNGWRKIRKIGSIKENEYVLEFGFTGYTQKSLSPVE